MGASRQSQVETPVVAEHFVGRLEDLPLQAIHRVEIDGRMIGIIRTADGVHAIGNRCPHQGAPMCYGLIGGTMLPSEPNEYIYGRNGSVLRCPWHAYEFDVKTGESIGGAIKGRVPVFEAWVRDGDVFCRLKRVSRTRDGA
jgi:nitrite reductase/ring-hydroxylating ferredoxin subunit